MKAYLHEKYGPPEELRFAETEKPEPKDGEVRVKVRAVAVNARDWRLATADPFIVRLMGGGFLRPKIQSLGSDVSGIIDAAGSGVTRFKVGDEVFGDICGGGFGGGGFAEYVCVPDKDLVAKPKGLSFEEAAALPMGGVTSLQGLRDVGGIASGQVVLINGASGGVGTFAVQIAKALGAEVTAVCSTGKMDLAKSLGADHVIDYTAEDFTKGDERYDLIFAVNGYHHIRDYGRVLKDGGRYAMVGGNAAQLFQALIQGPWLSRGGTKKFSAVTAHPSAEDLEFLKRLVEGGKLRSVIDKRYSFDQVPAAIRYVYEGHAAGKVVVVMD